MTISVEHIRKMKLPQKGRIVSANQNHHKISLTLNTRRGTLPKHSGQSSRFTFRSSGSATNFITRIIRSTLKEGCAGTISRVDWVCVVRRQLQKCRWNCTFSKKRCCKRKRASHCPCLDQRTLELSPRPSEHKRRCC